MELNNIYQSASSLYQELAQKRSELANIDKKDLEKSTQEKSDTVNGVDNKYDKKDYDRVVDKFQDLDAKTRAHEQMHSSGAPTTAPISYSYQTGPDGKLYASGGHVRFDTSMPKDEASANVKLDKIQSASSAPGELSAADAQISRTANLNKMLLQSMQEESA